jgi:hypothetical protein
MDPCFYRHVTLGEDPYIDALIILHVDDMRVAGDAKIVTDVYSKLFAQFQITKSDTGRFLGMDTDYDITSGVLRMHMTTYIKSTMDRFTTFDLSHGVPFREVVGSLLWIVLCVMGPELLRVKDLARKSNNFSDEDYFSVMDVLRRIDQRKSHGIIYRRGGAGKETVP